MATANKNSMLPTYQGNYKDMLGALKFGDITNPCLFWLEDEQNLCIIHWEKNEEGEKILVPHIILHETIDTFEKEMDEINSQLEGFVDEETGEPIKVKDFVEETTTPMKEDIAEIKEDLGKITVII